MNHHKLHIRRAVFEDANAIYNMMQKVESVLEDKTLYVCDDYEYVERHLEKEGFSLVACNEKGEIVGGFLFRFPGNAQDNLGRDIGLSEEVLDRVVHMESVAVLPEYRGHHLQEKMLYYAEKLIDKNKYSYLLATVSPNNPASYLSFEKCGYSLIMTKEKYGGLLRRIYQKYISGNSSAIDRIIGESCLHECGVGLKSNNCYYFEKYLPCILQIISL